jgi:hypothetical protein
MKKFIATSLCLGLVSTASFAQGLINVGNANTTDFYTSSNSAGTTVTATTAGSATSLFDYEVLTAPSTLPTGPGGSLLGLLSSPWSDTSLLFNNSALAGRVTAPSGSTVLSWPSAAAQDFVVVGWSANLGSWADVQADIASLTFNSSNGMYISSSATLTHGYIGMTVVGDLTSGAAGSGAGPNIFGTVGTGASPINTTTALYAIVAPEPTTFALIGLGGAAMLIFRRRK